MRIFKRWVIWYTVDGKLLDIVSYHMTRRGAGSLSLTLNLYASLTSRDLYIVRRAEP